MTVWEWGGERKTQLKEKKNVIQSKKHNKCYPEKCLQAKAPKRLCKLLERGRREWRVLVAEEHMPL